MRFQRDDSRKLCYKLYLASRWRCHRMSRNVSKNGEDQLITALASGTTVREAAKLAGVTERTVYRRREDAEFRSRVQEARKVMFEQALGAVASAGVSAAQKLNALLNANSENVQLGAARSVLELGSRLRENIELEERLSRLEQVLEKEKEHVH